MSTAAAADERPIGPRSRKGTQTRARLVDAAKVVFERDGFLEARITDIAEQAGLSHGSFYHYFDSKEQIFREVAAAMDERLNAPLTDVIHPTSPDSTFLERIEQGCRSFLESYRKDARLFSEVEQVARYDAELQAERQRLQRRHSSELADSIRQLQRRGLADRKLDAELASHALGAMVTRFADMWLSQKIVTCSFDTAVEQLSHLVANALQLPDMAPRQALRRRRS